MGVPSENRAWADDIVEAILACGGEAELSEIYEHLRENTDRDQGPSWIQNTRQRIYECSSDSTQFRGEDVFYSVGGLRSGRWGVRLEWLIEHGRMEPEEEDKNRYLSNSRSKEDQGAISPRTWYSEIFDAIFAHDGVATLSQVYEWIEENAPGRLTVAWKATVRRSLQDHSSDSEGYRGGIDSFYAVGGLGNGEWAIRSEWLEEEMPSLVEVKQPVESEEAALKNIFEQEGCTERILHATYQLNRNAKLARLLKRHYDYSCQVCGKSIRITDGHYVEVHHVKPRNSHSGKDVWENMVVLCPEHHVEFDYGVLAIDPEKLCYLHRFDKKIDGKKMFLKPPHTLEKEYIQYAKEVLFDT